MERAATALLVAIGVGFCVPARAAAQTAPTAGACSLLTKDEVKSHLPWETAFDFLPAEEEPLGDSGSSCEYPSVRIQLLSSPSRMLEIARERGGLEGVSGIGDEAYFHNNRDLFAELYVRIGARLLMIQAHGSGTVMSMRPGVLSLARALEAKLR